MKSLLHFSKFLVNANLDLVIKYILRKKINNDSVIYCLYKNIVNFSRMSQVNFCFKNPLKNVIQTNGEKNQRNPPSPWVMWTPI